MQLLVTFTILPLCAWAKKVWTRGRLQSRVVAEEKTDHLLVPNYDCTIFFRSSCPYKRASCFTFPSRSVWRLWEHWTSVEQQIAAPVSNGNIPDSDWITGWTVKGFVVRLRIRTSVLKLVWKIALGTSVCLSACKTLAPTRRICMKFDIWGFSKIWRGNSVSFTIWPE